MLTNFFIILFSTIAYLGSRHLFDFPICVLQWAAAHERKKLCSIVTKFFAPTLQLSVCPVSYTHLTLPTIYSV